MAKIRCGGLFLLITLMLAGVASAQSTVLHEGLLLPAKSALLRAPSSDRLLELKVDLAESVKQGQLLLRLADGQERAEMQRAQVLLDQANSEHGRLVKLQAEGGVSISELEMAANRVRMREAELSLARVALSERRLLAPFDGIVAARYVDEGSSVVEGDALLQISAQHPLRLELFLPERYAAAVRNGELVAHIHCSAPETTFVLPVAPRPVVIDPGSMSFPLAIEVDNRDGKLIPGASCRVELKPSGAGNHP